MKTEQKRKERRDKGIKHSHKRITSHIAEWGGISKGFIHHSIVKVGGTDTPEMNVSIYHSPSPEAQRNLVSLQMERAGYKKVKTPVADAGLQQMVKSTQTAHEVHYTDDGSEWHTHVFLKPEHVVKHIQKIGGNNNG